MHRRHLIALIAAALLSLPFASAQAQVTDQPVKIVFPFAPGGSGDALARLLAEHLRAGLNRQVIVENVTGASGLIGVRAVKNAAPDGATLLITPIAPVAVYPHSYKKLDYDPFTDFRTVTQVATFEFAIAVGPLAPVKSLKELVEWLKANPKHLSFGSPGAGTLPHFFGILFGRAIGLDLQHIPYRGSAAALADLVGGNIPVVVTTTSDLLAMHKAGRILILATSDRTRSAFVPEAPTFKEAGYDIEGVSWYGIFAPAKTPDEMVERYAKILNAALKLPQVKEKLLAFGLVPTGTTPAEFAAIQKRDSVLWAPAVKASGFTAEQ